MPEKCPICGQIHRSQEEVEADDLAAREKSLPKRIKKSKKEE